MGTGNHLLNAYMEQILIVFPSTGSLKSAFEILYGH